MDSSWIKLKPSWLAIAFIAFFISCDGFKFGRCSLEVAAACYAFRYIALLYELQLACWELFDMDQKATNLLAAMKSPGTPWDFGLHELHQLKGDIKHRQVPESAISPLFNLLGFAISSLHYVEVGLSILSHLTRRLVLQEQQGLLFTQGLRILPSIVNSLGDQQDRIRQRATQTLSDFWHLSSIDIEQLIRDTALTSESPRVKEASMRWIVKVCTILRDLRTLLSCRRQTRSMICSSKLSSLALSTVLKMQMEALGTQQKLLLSVYSGKF